MKTTRVSTAALAVLFAVLLGPALSAQPFVDAATCAANAPFSADANLLVDLDALGVPASATSLQVTALHGDAPSLVERYQLHPAAERGPRVLPLWLDGAYADPVFHAVREEVRDGLMLVFTVDEVEIAKVPLHILLAGDASLRAREVAVTPAIGLAVDDAAPAHASAARAPEFGFSCPNPGGFCEDEKDYCENDCDFGLSSCLQACEDEYQACRFGRLTNVRSERTLISTFNPGFAECGYYPWYKFFDYTAWDVTYATYRSRTYETYYCLATNQSFDVIASESTSVDTGYSATGQSCPPASRRIGYMGGLCRW
ncbi:MAG: hypothetical protein AAF772_06400 [Acidobacteriota bacterium]